MGEAEIKEMIDKEAGKKWRYVLEDIKHGDAFTLSKEDNYVQYILDRRMASYIIERWKDSKIPEVQELITVYRHVIWF